MAIKETHFPFQPNTSFSSLKHPHDLFDICMLVFGGTYIFHITVWDFPICIHNGKAMTVATLMGMHDSYDEHQPLLIVRKEVQGSSALFGTVCYFHGH